LEKTALTFYANIHYSTNYIEGLDPEKLLRQKFGPIPQTDILRIMFNKRKQLPDERTSSYINEVEPLYRRIDKNMPQKEIVHIMKGLKSWSQTLLRYICIIENKTLKKIKTNIKKYDLIEFVITGEIENSSFDIEKSISQNNI